MSEAALQTTEMSGTDPRFTHNQQINVVTGFIENPGFVYDFNSDRKLQYIDLIRRGFGKYKACSLMHLKDETVFKHMRIDTVFMQAIKDAERDYFDTLETVSRTNALEPKMVIERIFQLKNKFPEKYGDNKNTKQEVVITMNVSGASALIDSAKVIDAETDSTLSNPLANDDLSDGRP